VPVLSLHKTLTEPSVSTVDNTLTKTWCFAMRLAIILRVSVTATGSPSGRNATIAPMIFMMIADHDRKVGYFTLNYPSHTKKMTRPVVNANTVITMTNLLSSFFKLELVVSVEAI